MVLEQVKSAGGQAVGHFHLSARERWGRKRREENRGGWKGVFRVEGVWRVGWVGTINNGDCFSFFLSFLLSFVLDKWGLLFWEGRGALFFAGTRELDGMGWDGMVGSARLAICTGERS